MKSHSRRILVQNLQDLFTAGLIFTALVIVSYGIISLTVAMNR